MAWKTNCHYYDDFVQPVTDFLTGIGYIGTTIFNSFSFILNQFLINLAKQK